MAILNIAVAIPLDEAPETRLVSLSVSNNLTITTVAHVVSQQSQSLLAMTTTFFSLNLNYFSPSIFTQYNWFLLNYMVVGTQLTIINTALATLTGANLIVGGPSGKKSVSDGMSVIIATLNQANQYYSAMDATAASAISVKIKAIVTLQGKINTAMSCANIFQTMIFSCNDSFFTLIAKFMYLAANVMMEIVVGWCGICSSDATKCAVTRATSESTPLPTTTPGSTTTAPSTTTLEPSFVSFNQDTFFSTLLNIFYTVPRFSVLRRF